MLDQRGGRLIFRDIEKNIFVAAISRSVFLKKASTNIHPGGCIEKNRIPSRGINSALFYTEITQINTLVRRLT